MTVGVITDSAAALDPAQAERFGITVVPIRVTIGGMTYRDGEVSREEMLRRIDEKVSTAGPSPAEFVEAMRRHQEQGAVVLTVAEALSSTYSTAKLAQEQAGGMVRIVDTKTAAGAQALVAIAAARAAHEGGSIHEVEAAARRAIDRVRLVAGVETLDYLIRSGRLSGVLGGMAQRLGVRPLFELELGQIQRLRPAMSRDGLIQRILGRWRSSRVPGAKLHCTALHAFAPTDAELLLGRVREEEAPETALVAEFGSAMVVHTGPGVVGLAWWWDEAATLPPRGGGVAR